MNTTARRGFPAGCEIRIALRKEQPEAGQLSGLHLGLIGGFLLFCRRGLLGGIGGCALSSPPFLFAPFLPLLLWSTAPFLLPFLLSVTYQPLPLKWIAGGLMSRTTLLLAHALHVGVEVSDHV